MHKLGHLSFADPFRLFMQVFNEISSREMEKINVFQGMLQNYVFVGVLTCTVVFQFIIIQFLGAVSYTHLTLPTIYSV